MIRPYSNYNCGLLTPHLKLGPVYVFPPHKILWEPNSYALSILRLCLSIKGAQKVLVIVNLSVSLFRLVMKVHLYVMCRFILYDFYKATAFIVIIVYIKLIISSILIGDPVQITVMAGSKTSEILHRKMSVLPEWNTKMHDILNFLWWYYLTFHYNPHHQNEFLFCF